MPQDSNPFNSQTYSSPEVFVDRGGMMSVIAQGLRNTVNENPQNFLITGERGIGKSSTIEYLNQRLVENKEHNYRFLSVLIKLDKGTERNILIEAIENGTRKKIANLSKFKSAKHFFRSFLEAINEVTAFGFGLSFNEETLRCKNVSELGKWLSKSSLEAKSIDKDVKSGILITFDEADNAPDNIELGEFLKLLIESIRENNCSNTCFVVSGLPEVEEKLVRSHESVMRLFTKIELEDLDQQETAKLLRNGIRNANRKRHTNSKTRTITMEDTIIEKIYTITKGKPYLIHKVAGSMYDYAKSDMIKLNDLKSCPEYKKLL